MIELEKHQVVRVRGYGYPLRVLDRPAGGRVVLVATISRNFVLNTSVDQIESYDYVQPLNQIDGCDSYPKNYSKGIYSA